VLEKLGVTTRGDAVVAARRRGVELGPQDGGAETVSPG
jgi:hypothetical protein